MEYRPHSHILLSRSLAGLVSMAVLIVATPVAAQAPSREAFEKALAVDLPDDPAAIIAVVGDSKILMGDVKPKVDAKIKEVIGKTKQSIPEDQIKYARVNLTRGLLGQVIQTKMMRESFLLSQVATEAADKRQEASEMMASRARQLFIDSEVPELLKRYKVDDMTQLDEKLRESGSSLYARQRDFTDAMLGHMYMRSAVEQEPEVSLAEIVAYYDDHRSDYEHKAQARWEQLTVYYENFPSKKAAHAAIWEMGREAYFGAPSMQGVARAKSQEPMAKSGGVHDWTNQGSLASDILDKNIFSLPLNANSDIIADETGYHIIRVLERKPAGVTPLAEVQMEIKKKIQQQKVAAAQREMLAEMTKLVPVWSLFPEDFPGAKPLPRTAARAQPATKFR